MPFGRALLPLWPLDPAATYLNHGTVGVVPIRVAEAQQVWRDRIERHPAKFMLRDLWSFTGSAASGPTLMRQAAAEVAAFAGARGEDLVFVDNTSTGVSAVLQSMTFHPGDEILVTDHIYGGLLTAVNYIARRSGATARVVEMPYPAFDAAVAVERLSAAITPHTKLVLIDHIAAESAIVFPVTEMVRVCKAAGVPVLVDGAHVPGQLELDVTAIGADYYVANLHKWAMAPRSSAFLVATPARQAGLHPPVISWGLDTGFTQEFDWVGTRDATPWLAAPEGIRFLQDLDYDALRRHNHDLAWTAAQYLTDFWGTKLELPESAVGSMVSVMTPASVGSTKPDAVRLRDHLLFDHNIEVQVHARAGRVWVRVSAQAYNTLDDIKKLGDAVSVHALGH
jgi:isopenicillin-N epimerase